MKVLNIIQRYYPAIGGSENWCRDFCLFLKSKGIFVRVVTMNMYRIEEAFDSNFSDADFIKLGEKDFEKGVFIKRYELWKPWQKTFSARIINFLLYKAGLYKTEIGDIFRISPHSFRMYLALFKEIKEADIVVLHTLPYFHNLIGYLIAKLWRRNIVIIPHFHPGHVHYEKNIFFNIMNRCDAIIVKSEYEKKCLVERSVNSDKIFVSGACISVQDSEMECKNIDNVRDFLISKYKITEQHKRIIFIGRKEIYKGIFILIEAARRLADENNMDMFLFLVGPDATDFKKKYADLNNLGHLKIIDFGVISDEEKDSLVKFSNVLVLPSKFESFGIVFLEAWKHGKPVIGIDSGAIPEIIGDAGLCAIPDNVDDLKEKIEKILFNDDLAKKMGARGREKLEKKYNAFQVYGKVLDVFNRLLDKNNTKRILIASMLFPPDVLGGSEIVAYEQSKKIKQMGFKVKIFAGRLNDKLRRYAVNQENNGFDITRINLHHADFDNNTYANFSKRQIREKFREELYSYCPDIVHFHNIFSLSLDMINECMEMNIPIIATLHDYWGICFRNILLKENRDICIKKDGDCSCCCPEGLFLENRDRILIQERNLKFLEYYNRFNLLISPSRYLAERYIERGVSREKFSIISNGIDNLKFQKNKKNKAKFSKIKFAYIGQFRWHKGVENLIDAVKLLERNEQDKIFVLLIGSENDAFLRYCKELSKELRFIKFLGKADHGKIPEMLRKIDVLIVPSIWPENSPCTILEAMASGTPVIASDLGGIPELVDDGINGFLFKHDDPEALAEKIREIIRDPAKIGKMKKACFKKAEEHNIINKIERISKCYRKVLDTI